MLDLTIVAIAIVLVSGLVRGITGFGGAMLMTPPLSLFVGSVGAVVIALMLETAAALVALPDAWPHIDRRKLAFLAIPACLTVPIGGYFLVSIDPLTARRLIGGIVVTFSLVMLAGFRYSGAPRAGTSIALGGVCGVLLGATSIGAPPVILYLLSGPDPIKVTRANLIAFVGVTSAAGVVMLLASGAVGAEFAASAAALAVPYLLATWVGGRLFRRLNEGGVRRLALLLMLGVGLVGLLAT